MRFKFGLGIVIWLLLAACKAPVEENMPIIIPEKLDVWAVGFTESTAWIVDFLPECAESAPIAGVLVYSMADIANIEETLDLVFTWGAVDSPFQNAVTLIENEELVVVVHADVPYRELTKEQAADIFSGKITDWGDLNPLSSFAGEIGVWRFVPESGAEHNLQVVLGTTSTGTGNLAAGVDDMVKGIQSNQFSIGYLPARLVPDDLEVIAITDSVSMPLPILVGAQSVITAEQNTWLVCLQQKIEINRQESLP